MTTLLIFYSFPIEASLTAIVRGIEVAKPNRVFIVASYRRCEEVSYIVNVLKNSYNDIEFVLRCSIPDVETSIEDIPKVIDVMKNLVNEIDDDIYFVASSGSRLEIASISMVLDRAKTEVLYISFIWGPWKGAFYPYTPKPLEIVHEIHPMDRGFKLGSLPNGEVLVKLLGISIPRLRRETLFEQYGLNKHYSDSLCIATRDGIDCSCRGIEIGIMHGSSKKVDIEIYNYCSHEKVVEGVSKLCEDLLDLEGRIPEDVYSSLLLLARISGVCILCVDEYEHDNQLKNVIFIDAIRKLSRVVAIDTNIMYFGLQNQIYEDLEIFRRYLILPLCLYLEAYEHQAQGAKPYHKLRSAISSLLIEELNYWNFIRDDSIFHRPCEVGLAVTSRNRYIVATGDRKAYQRLFKMVGVESILATTRPINKIVFMQNEVSRKISYAYYALAQLKALTKISEISTALHELGISIEMKSK